MAKKPKTSAWLQTTAVRLTRVHIIYAVCFLLSVVVFDSSNLYTHQAISQFWTAGGLLLAATVVLWFMSRLNVDNQWYYIGLCLALILIDIVFATYLVYMQRGLYSKAVVLYTIPILSAAALRSRSIVFGTAGLSATLYSTVSVRYFFQNYGLGYRVELWATVGFFSAMFIVLALLLMIIIRPTQEKF